MTDIKVTFSLNRYDRDGDIFEEGVFLHFGDTSVKVCDHPAEFKCFLVQIKIIAKELEKERKGKR